MKKLFLLPFFLLVFASCDKVDNPVENRKQVEVKQRKVLLEDYTGHTCGNCPAAAEVAEKLYEQNPENLVVVAVHAGFFSRVKSGYPTSYTTTAGVEWDKYFIGNAGNPNGLVNRKNIQDNGLVQSQSKWPTTVSLAMNEPYILDLDINATYSASTRKLNTSVKGKFSAAYSNNIGISVLLLEDSIVGPQTDYRQTGDDKVPNYVFMHMLRDAINGTWGTSFKTGPSGAKDSVTVSFNDFAVKPGFNDKHLTVVAFAFDETTKEVLEAEKVKIKP
jgi:thiol-disulfide isomerase/thioredoxin